MSATREAVIAEYLKALKMPTIGREYGAMARQARDEGWPYEDFLRELLEAEIRARHDTVAARRLREAKFPDIKTLEQIDWEALQGISRPKLLELASCAFIEAGEDIVLAGPVGTGKSHVAIGLGVEATRRRYRVAFRRVAELVRSLLEARDDRVLGRLHKQFERVDLLIVDEFGFVPFDRAGGEVLFNLLSERHSRRRSTIVTTNLAFSEWVQVLGSEKLTTALLDRLGARAHVMTFKRMIKTINNSLTRKSCSWFSLVILFTDARSKSSLFARQRPIAVVSLKTQLILASTTTFPQLGSPPPHHLSSCTHLARSASP